MKVYIVMQCERGEGGSPECTFSTKRKAVNYVKKHEKKLQFTCDYYNIVEQEVK